MAEIKPPIVLNFTPPAGGGAAARFGIEDTTSDVDRSFDASHKGFEVYNASYTGITSQDDNGFAAFRTDLNAEPSNPVQAIIQTGGAADSSALVLTPTEIYVTTTRLNKNAHLALSVNNNFAGPDGNITLAGGGGAAARFGAEDNTAAENRRFNLPGFDFEVKADSADRPYVGRLQINRYGNFDVRSFSNDTGGYAGVMGSTDDAAGVPGGRLTLEAGDGNIQNHTLMLSGDGVVVRGGSSVYRPKFSVLENSPTAPPSSKLKIEKQIEFADNAAALAGGLTLGDTYHTGGVLKIVI